METKTKLLIELLEKCDELEKENFMQLVTISTLEEEIKELKTKIEHLEADLERYDNQVDQEGA